MDQSLTDIEKQLDPSLFYRLNRKWLVQQSAIGRIRAFPKIKLHELEPPVNEEIIISQENVAAFKDWMGS